MTVAVAWSGGKDAALLLQEVLEPTADTSAGAETDSPRVDRLFTTVNAAVDRVTIHGVRTALVEAQAEAVGLPLEVRRLPDGLDGDTYDRRMAALYDRLAAGGVDAVAYADLHLDDVRRYREATLADAPLTGRWPLWGRDPEAVVRQFVADDRFAATVCCVDPAQVDAGLVGRELDADFLEALPADADSCGENGEYHSFVTDAPYFDEPVGVTVGETVRRPTAEGELVYCDLVPA